MLLTIDVVILSNAKNKTLTDLTIATVNSLLSSNKTSQINFNIVVIESNKAIAPYQFPNTTTLYPTEDFGFNKFLNIGIKHTHGQYVCLANNDLIFSNGWAESLLEEFEKDQTLYSANAFCENFDYREEVRNGPNVMSNIEYPNTFGILTGWFIFVRRDIFNIIGELDEKFKFWYADNDYELTLKKYEVKHALIKSSRVLHIGNQSHEILDDKRNEMTYAQRKVFENKWGYKNRFHRWADKLIKRIFR
ncbi:glycosyltransferase family 2 protein [Pedobacter rhizosphaerae]|uniref:Glycosyltransferase, GT2 family n=1 Tax=Pedobacter rhizosphaerae TaxID=390241 RepID=A0A1H9N7B3_9SPHI|nr:glycosyltransferase [Pedobacter rhizosphaerae]SER31667.1 Glycosyltransferase, GT2 family [Pedobacter rhizosphaerae]